MTTYPGAAPKKRNIWMWVAIATGIVLAVCMIGGVIGSLGGSKPPSTTGNGWGSDSVATATPSPAASAKTSPVATETKESPAAPSKAATQTFGSGTYVVGSEMPTGRYTATMKDGDYCYWERLKNDSGDVDDIIANEVYADPGKRSFTVKKGDKYVQLKGDCIWSKA